MTIPKPSWWDYIEWGYDKDKEPYMIGWKKGTPKKLIKEFEEYQKEREEAEKRGEMW